MLEKWWAFHMVKLKSRPKLTLTADLVRFNLISEISFIHENIDEPDSQIGVVTDDVSSLLTGTIHNHRSLTIRRFGHLV